MSPRDHFAEAAQAILERLLAGTGASRATLRLDDPALGFRIDDVVAEALAPGERSMRGVGGINHRAANTAQWLERHRRLLVQNDLAATDWPAPLGLTQGFGVKAQMLAPLERDGRLDGWISVHEAKAARAWSEADQAGASTAAAEIRSLLGDVR
jgi:maleate isomerase